MRVKGNVEPLSVVRGCPGLAMGTINSLLSHALPCPPSICTGIISYLRECLSWKSACDAARGSTGQGHGCSVEGAQPSMHPSREGTRAGDTEPGAAGPEHPTRALSLVHADKQGVQPGRANVCAWAHVHVGVCAHTRVHVCMCAHMCICSCLHTWWYVHTCAHTCSCVSLCACGYILVHTWVCVHTFMCVHCARVCMHICTHGCIAHVHVCASCTCIPVHACTHSCTCT